MQPTFHLHMGIAKAPVCNLVNSKMPWKAILHLTLKGQRDCGCCVKQYTPMLWKFHSSDLTNRVTEGFETLSKVVPERGIIGTAEGYCVAPALCSPSGTVVNDLVHSMPL